MHFASVQQADSPLLRAAVRRTFALVALVVAIDTFVAALTAEKLNFLYKDKLVLDASSVATLAIVLNIPAYLRPLIGWMSDLVPLLGYHRRSYFLLAALLEAVSLLTLSLVAHYTYWLVALCALGQVAGVALMFVMMESVMVRIGNASGQTGRMQTVQQLVRYGLIAAVAGHISGYVTQHWSYTECFRAASLATLAVLPLTFLIEDPRVTHGGSAASEARAREHAAKLAEKKADHARSAAALLGAIRTPSLWAVILFILFLCSVPGIGTAQFYYEVDALHYGKQFLGDLNSYSAAGFVVGFLTYAAIAPRLSGRILVWGLVLLSVFGTVPFFWLRSELSGAIITLGTSVLGGWFLLALLAVGARACPPRAEATFYAMVYAMQFLGNALSTKLGSAIYDAYGGAHHELLRGWTAMLWAGTLIPIASIAFLPFLPAWTRTAAPLTPEPEEAEAAGLPPARQINEVAR